MIGYKTNMKQQYFGKLCQDRITQSNLGVSENGGIPEIRTNIAFLMEEMRQTQMSLGAWMCH